jgi:hypothetical protein
VARKPIRDIYRYRYIYDTNPKKRRKNSWHPKDKNGNYKKGTKKKKPLPKKGMNRPQSGRSLDKSMSTEKRRRPPKGGNSTLMSQFQHLRLKFVLVFLFHACRACMLHESKRAVSTGKECKGEERGENKIPILVPPKNQLSERSHRVVDIASRDKEISFG